MKLFTKAISEPATRQSARKSIDDITALCHQLAKEAGWWNDPGTGEPLNPAEQTSEKLLLIHSEVSEATEGFRKALMDDKLPDRTMLEVELADALIRIHDLAGALGLDLGGAVVDKLHYNTMREDHKPENRMREGGKKF